MRGAGDHLAPAQAVFGCLQQVGAGADESRDDGVHACGHGVGFHPILGVGLHDHLDQAVAASGSHVMGDVAQVNLVAVVDRQKVTFGAARVEQAVLQHRKVARVARWQMRCRPFGLNRNQGQGRNVGQFRLFDDRAQLPLCHIVLRCDPAPAGAGAKGQGVQPACGLVFRNGAGAGRFRQPQHLQLDKGHEDQHPGRRLHHGQGKVVENHRRKGEGQLRHHVAQRLILHDKTQPKAGTRLLRHQHYPAEELLGQAAGLQGTAVRQSCVRDNQHQFSALSG